MSLGAQKRVLIVADSVLAGDATGKHTCDLARVMLDEGWDVRVRYSGVFTQADDEIRRIGMVMRPGDPLPEADLLILEYAGWYPLAERIRRCQCRSIFWYHGVTPPELWGAEADRYSLERSIFGANLARFASAVVACSPFGAAELAAHADLPTRSVHVVPNPVNYDSFTEKSSPSQLHTLRRQLDAVDKRVILYVGRVAGNKRIDLLVEATSRLRDRYPELMLLVVGDDRSSPAYAECAARIRAQVSGLGLERHVRMLGKVPSVEPFYQIADVLALPSEHEGFGVPLIEAMAAGVPVVASDAAAMPWVIGAHTDAPAGLLFQRGSAIGLADAIALVLDDSSLAAELRTRGAKRVELYTPQVFRTNTLDIVQQVVAADQDRKSVAAWEDPLIERADVALREYRVRSGAPLVGRAIEWVRTNMTSHVKEAYLDQIVERQVVYNMTLANRLRELTYRVEALSLELAELRAQDPVPGKAAVDPGKEES